MTDRINILGSQVEFISELFITTLGCTQVTENCGENHVLSFYANNNLVRVFTSTDATNIIPIVRAGRPSEVLTGVLDLCAQCNVSARIEMQPLNPSKTEMSILVYIPGIIRFHLL